jgi:hypothetical protein
MRTPSSGEIEAKIEYCDGHFRVLEPGKFVTCAVTGRRVALADLRYWSVERQEAYVDGEAALKALGQKSIAKP